MGVNLQSLNESRVLMSKLRCFGKALNYIAVVGASLILVACGGGSSGNTGLKLSLTDAPACGYDHVYVTVQKIGVHSSATAANSDSGWRETVLNPALKVDLLTLTNGVLQTLGQIPLAAGHYSQIRLVLASNAGADAYANSVFPTGGALKALETPSALQSGIKLNADITINANQMADFVVDFDACKSVVTAGKSGRYLLKPVIAVTPNYISGVSGYLHQTVANGDTLISLQQNGVVVKATSPDATTGGFLLQPVAPGVNYDIVITSPGKVATVITGVPVVDQQVTALNTQTNKILPAVGDVGTARGVVTVASAVTPIDATVSAKQGLVGTGRTVEIANTSVDAGTGGYTLTLPAAAPNVAAYSTSQSYTFVADPVAGQYTLTATTGGSERTASIALEDGQTVTTNFSFP